MNKHAISITKKLFNQGLACITNPHWLFIGSETQQGKSLVGQRTAFTEFHEHMFSLSDIEVQSLLKAYKRFYAAQKLSESDEVFADVLMLKDAIDYQLCIRSSDGFDIQQISEDVANSWQQNVRLAEGFGEITSSHLIALAKRIGEDFAQ